MFKKNKFNQYSIENYKRRIHFFFCCRLAWKHCTCAGSCAHREKSNQMFEFQKVSQVNVLVQCKWRLYHLWNLCAPFTWSHFLWPITIMLWWDKRAVIKINSQDFSSLRQGHAAPECWGRRRKGRHRECLDGQSQVGRDVKRWGVILF